MIGPIKFHKKPDHLYLGCVGGAALTVDRKSGEILIYFCPLSEGGAAKGFDSFCIRKIDQSKFSVSLKLKNFQEIKIGEGFSCQKELTEWAYSANNLIKQFS